MSSRKEQLRLRALISAMNKAEAHATIVRYSAADSPTEDVSDPQISKLLESLQPQLLAFLKKNLFFDQRVIDEVCAGIYRLMIESGISAEQPDMVLTCCKRALLAALDCWRVAEGQWRPCSVSLVTVSGTRQTIDFRNRAALRDAVYTAVDLAYDQESTPVLFVLDSRPET